MDSPTWDSPTMFPLPKWDVPMFPSFQDVTYGWEHSDGIILLTPTTPLKDGGFWFCRQPSAFRRSGARRSRRRSPQIEAGPRRRATHEIRG
jgi:hypothetical protein